MIKRIVIGLGIVLAMLFSSLPAMAAPAVSQGPTPVSQSVQVTQAGGGVMIPQSVFKRSVTNSIFSNATITVCEVKRLNGTCKSGLGSLKPGQNTRDKYNWSSVDMVRVGPSCKTSLSNRLSRKTINGGPRGEWTGIFPLWTTQVITTCPKR